MNATDQEILTMARRLARLLHRYVEAGVEAGCDMDDDIAMLAEWETLEARIRAARGIPLPRQPLETL